jgi:uncharacterized damage-inducible protein DinB
MKLSEYRLLFAYDCWANGRLLQAAGELDGDRYAQELGGSFASVRDTMAHIVAVEWIWLRRWCGESPSAMPDWAVAPESAALRRKLDEIEVEQDRFMATLSDEGLQRIVEYRNLKGETYRYPLGDLLLHLVNHSTYHRGQAATLLRQLGAVPPPTDFLVFKSELAE